MDSFTVYFLSFQICYSISFSIILYWFLYP